MENGRRVHPVDSVTLAGNFFDLLKAIRARGDAYQPNLSRRFIPALLVDGLVVASSANHRVDRHIDSWILVPDRMGCVDRSATLDGLFCLPHLGSSTCRR